MLILFWSVLNMAYIIYGNKQTSKPNNSFIIMYEYNAGS